MTESKVALIAAQSPELTKAISKRYAHEKYELIILHKDIAVLEQTDDEIQSLGHKATLVPICDEQLNEKDNDYLSIVQNLKQSIENKYNILDTLVLGIDVPCELSLTVDYEYNTFNKNIHNNIVLNWLLLKTFDVMLKRSTNGRVIFTKSGLISNNTSTSFWSLYNSIEASMVKIIQTYAKENQQTNLKVNIVNPGLFDSRAFKSYYPGKSLENMVKADQITDIFVKLSSEKCVLTGIEHSAQY